MEEYYTQIPNDENIDMSIGSNISEKVSISKSTRWFVYILFIVTNIFITIDHGSIPASTWNLYKIFNSNQEIGLFGSLVFLGNLLGSMLYFYLTNIIHRKKLLICSMFFLVICLITFILTTNTLFLLANRIIFGIFQSYVFIYFPLWCNQYGITNKSSIMLSFGQLTFPIGVLLGYVIGSICITINKDNGWKYSFVIQSIVVSIMIIPFFYAPESVFEVKYESFQDSNRNNNKILFRISSTIIEEIDTDENMNNILKVATISKKELFEILKKIMKQKIFISSVLALSCLYFCITGLQYWGSDYMNRVLRVHSPERRLLYFSLICFSSPTIGVILGGYILNYLQGFEIKKYLIYALFYQY